MWNMYGPLNHVQPAPQLLHLIHPRSNQPHRFVSLTPLSAQDDDKDTVIHRLYREWERRFHFPNDDWDEDLESLSRPKPVIVREQPQMPAPTRDSFSSQDTAPAARPLPSTATAPPGPSPSRPPSLEDLLRWSPPTSPRPTTAVA